MLMLFFIGVWKFSWLPAETKAFLSAIQPLGFDLTCIILVFSFYTDDWNITSTSSPPLSMTQKDMICKKNKQKKTTTKNLIQKPFLLFSCVLTTDCMEEQACVSEMIQLRHRFTRLVKTGPRTWTRWPSFCPVLKQTWGMIVSLHEMRYLIHMANVEALLSILVQIIE